MEHTQEWPCVKGLPYVYMCYGLLSSPNKTFLINCKASIGRWCCLCQLLLLRDLLVFLDIKRVLDSRECKTTKGIQTFNNCSIAIPLYHQLERLDSVDRNSCISTHCGYILHARSRERLKHEEHCTRLLPERQLLVPK